MTFNRELYAKFMDDYAAVAAKYELDKSVDFKKAAAFLGIYEEKGGETYMVRPRTGAGVLSKETLRAICRIANEFTPGSIHFTTRQNIQFHRVPLGDTVKLVEKLVEAGLTAMGSGGNAARNVSCSPLSGISDDEVFDVTPFAVRVNQELTQDDQYLFLPRKYKVAFSNSSSDTANTTTADLGFLAVLLNGKPGFKVYAGGGIGPASRVALKIEDFIEPKDIMYYVKGMKLFFEAEGDWNNKARARIRHIVTRLGEEEFISLYRRTVEQLKKNENLDVDIAIQSRPMARDDDPREVVIVHPTAGTITTSDAEKILDYLDGLGYETDIRLTLGQEMIVRNIKPSDAADLKELISEFCNDKPILQSIACVGSSICKTGIANSQELLMLIREHFANADREILDNAPAVYISGCPSSCARHHIAALGFMGRIKKIDNETRTFFSAYIGGKVADGGTRLSRSIGDLPMEDVPGFIEKLTRIKIESGIENIEDFFESKSSAGTIEELFT